MIKPEIGAVYALTDSRLVIKVTGIVSPKIVDFVKYQKENYENVQKGKKEALKVISVGRGTIELLGQKISK